MTKMTLFLGVADIPYSEAPWPLLAAKFKKYRKPGAQATRKAIARVVVTTGEVAQDLEKRYGVMEFFFHSREDRIAQALEQSVAKALEAMLEGNPSALVDVFAPASQIIHELFRDFLMTHGMDGQPGVPTKAALEGRSSRFKSGFGPKNRPSFIDTGLYSANFRAWVKGGSNAIDF